MNHTIPLTIIIPSHNSERTINQCLDSTFQEFGSEHQVIVADDCSHDKSPEIVAGYPVVFLNHDKRCGAGAARNRGIAQASHPWILFLDSDIVVKPGTYQILQNAFKNHPEDVSFGSVSDLQPANRGIFQEFLACRAHFQYASGPEYSTAFPSQLVLVKKEVFEKFGVFSERFVTAGGEEFEMGYRLSQNGIRTRILPDFQFYHVYDGFWERLKKYFLRSRIYYQLFKVQGSFETVIASVTETIRSLYTFYGLLGFLAFPSLLYLVIYLFIYLLLDSKFLRFLVKRKGLLFAIYASAVNYTVFIAIALGGLVAVFEDGFRLLFVRKKVQPC